MSIVSLLPINDAIYETYTYYCNGINDNVLLSNLIRYLPRGTSTNTRYYYINVIGNIGVTYVSENVYFNFTTPYGNRSYSYVKIDWSRATFNDMVLAPYSDFMRFILINTSIEMVNLNLHINIPKNTAVPSTTSRFIMIGYTYISNSSYEMMALRECNLSMYDADNNNTVKKYIVTYDDSRSCRFQYHMYNSRFEIFDDTTDVSYGNTSLLVIVAPIYLGNGINCIINGCTIINKSGPLFTTIGNNLRLYGIYLSIYRNGDYISGSLPSSDSGNMITSCRIIFYGVSGSLMADPADDICAIKCGHDTNISSCIFNLYRYTCYGIYLDQISGAGSLIEPRSQINDCQFYLYGIELEQYILKHFSIIIIKAFQNSKISNTTMFIHSSRVQGDYSSRNIYGKIIGIYCGKAAYSTDVYDYQACLISNVKIRLTDGSDSFIAPNLEYFCGIYISMMDVIINNCMFDLSMTLGTQYAVYILGTTNSNSNGRNNRCVITDCVFKLLYSTSLPSIPGTAIYSDNGSNIYQSINISNNIFKRGGTGNASSYPVNNISLPNGTNMKRLQITGNMFSAANIKIAGTDVTSLTSSAKQYMPEFSNVFNV